MAKGKGKGKGKRKGGGAANRAKFTRVAKACHKELRAGALPKIGDFKRCMTSGLR